MSDHSFREWLDSLSPEEQQAVVENLHNHPLAAPSPGPQTQAFNCEAEVLGYGGAAGGGKSALIALLALFAHERSIIFRREKTQINSLIDDIVTFNGSDEGLNRQQSIFRIHKRSANHQVQWAQLRDPGDELAHQGQQRDLMAFDEATQINPKQIQFVSGWNRSTTPGQRKRIIYTFNPPGAVDVSDGNMILAEQGRWVINYFAPWLDERHPDPAEPGETRWFYRDSRGIEIEKKDAKPVEIEIRGKSFKSKPKSRCFIPSHVWDNEYLRDSGYVEHLMSLEEPLRSQLLMGDFRSGINDVERQLIKTDWVDDAMDRWEKKKIEYRAKPMDSMGVDVSRGGLDFTVISRRHEFFWDEMIRFRGEKSDDGPKVASECIKHVRDGAEICIDILGPGSSPHDFLKEQNQNVYAVLSQKRKMIPQPEGELKMYNLRASLWWMLRKILDPANGCDAALPPDNRLRSELLAPRYEQDSQGMLKIESKEDIKRRLGHSTDEADALCYTLLNILHDPLGSMISGIHHVETLKFFMRPQVTQQHLEAGWMVN